MGFLKRYGIVLTALLVLLLMIFFVWSSGGKGIGRHEARIDIARPVGVVFGWLHEPDKLPQWTEDLVSVRYLGEGDLRAGARFEQVLLLDGEEHRFESEVLEVEPERLLRLRVITDGFAIETRFELQPRDERNTSLYYYSVARYEGVWMRLMEPLITSSTQVRVESDLATLKRLLESTGSL